MEKEGKRKVKEEEQEKEEEKDISKLVLGIMEGYSDSVIPPLSHFQSPRSESAINVVAEYNSSSKRKRENIRPKPPKEDCLGRERDRRVKMNESFALLESIVPSLLPKSSKEKVLQTTTEYIKYLEEKKKMLEKLKESSRSPMAATRSLVFPCTSRNSSVTVTACGSVALFGIESRKRHGFVTQIFMVFQKHRAEVLAANVVVNDGLLTLTVTAFVNGDESTTIEGIKRDILMLKNLDGV
ncbi:hypothetical protein L484_008473 [Morus notabilis]|uniref:BHLH domain-containing protein n=1 Tax=Morus notabilis TaxID=981085 RepID=W9RQ46_9ROSA|nr:hypothetical protein L484_008473 [Morus notabilis]